jgi:hypothetical protein
MRARAPAKTRHQNHPTVRRAVAGVNDFGLRANGAAIGAKGLTISLKIRSALSSPAPRPAPRRSPLMRKQYRTLFGAPPLWQCDRRDAGASAEYDVCAGRARPDPIR